MRLLLFSVGACELPPRFRHRTRERRSRSGGTSMEKTALAPPPSYHIGTAGTGHLESSMSECMTFVLV